jgi:hypothetical protein
MPAPPYMSRETIPRLIRQKGAAQVDHRIFAQQFVPPRRIDDGRRLACLLSVIALCSIVVAGCASAEALRDKARPTRRVSDP